MRSHRTVSIVVAVALASAMLSGCGLLQPVENKTSSVVQELEGMPGIVKVTPSTREAGLSRPAYSSVTLELDPAVTEPQVLEILNAFAAVNVRTGVENVGTILILLVPRELPLETDSIRLHFAHPAPEQLALLARAWFELRGEFAGVGVDLVDGGIAASAPVFEVSMRMPEGAVDTDDIGAIRRIAGLFGDVGVVRKIFLAGGLTRVVNGLPGEETLSLAQSILETDGVVTAETQFWGDELVRVTVRVSEESAIVDPGLGVPRLFADVVDRVPHDAPAVQLTFEVVDAVASTAAFNNERCEFGDDAAGDLSRKLVSYWARDGRSLLDGSSAESCA